MRFKSIAIALLLLLATFSLQARDYSIFTKFGENEKITSVYVSKALLSLAGENVDMGMSDMGGANVNKLLSKMEQIEIYSSSDAATAKNMSSEANKYIKSGVFENLMKVRDGGDNIDFLIKKDSNKSDIIKEFLMLVAEESECTIIRIMGAFTLDDVKDVINESKK